MDPDVEQGSTTTKQVGVELKLQENSLSDVVANTHETPETMLRNQMWSKVPRPRSKWELSFSCKKTHLVML